MWTKSGSESHWLPPHLLRTYSWFCSSTHWPPDLKCYIVREGALWCINTFILSRENLDLYIYNIYKRFSSQFRHISRKQFPISISRVQVKGCFTWWQFGGTIGKAEVKKLKGFTGGYLADLEEPGITAQITEAHQQQALYGVFAQHGDQFAHDLKWHKGVCSEKSLKNNTSFLSKASRYNVIERRDFSYSNSLWFVIVVTARLCEF